ncbi:DUF2927 domain-containing protein [Octadecabacter sp. 1_MG-2023]|uniref:DUF2927 domain-containing protein n=1 Tax=unclassified Octadecabacter TaxID=196158 RepID=UPI001C094659|nr:MULTISPECIES: DUF2927 domain-containing protein [unclassified Octadecabacter]MBU2993633.1 DUF2927 domain-containing protein [Octadecabacter sp. B2R22]MDO6735523.1 DUF2927 domain-containing protein [Octadecabacter sp. 1_MG-2023]
MNRTFRRLMALSVMFMTACTPAPQSPTLPTRTMGLQDSLPPMRSFAGNTVNTPTRSNREIGKDFMDLAFQMESGRPIARLTRFEAPITVRVTGQIPPSLTPDLRALLGRFRNEAGIDIFMTGAADASITVEAIPRAVLNAAVPRAACFVVPRVSSWEEFKSVRRTPTVDWTTLERRDRAAVFVPSDVAPQEIRDCLHEELAQALGPLNDLYRLSDSVFNDDNIHAVLTSFDMLILRAYYDPALSNGMTRGQVAARLNAVLSRQNPAGDTRPARPQNDTTRDWIENIETALTGGSSGNNRRNAALQAVSLAGAHNWSGPRDGFAHYAFGRLNVGYDSDIALSAFNESLRIYNRSPETRLHAAHVSVQLAAFALSTGDGQAVLNLTDSSIPIARSHENAALLATLMMFKAEALEMLGRAPEARIVRMDSLGWARYGFGADVNVRARLREIASLNPLKGT